MSSTPPSHVSVATISACDRRRHLASHGRAPHPSGAVPLAPTVLSAGCVRRQRVDSRSRRRSPSSESAVAGSPPRMPRPMSFGQFESAERSPRHPRPGCMTSGCSDDPLLHVRVPATAARLRSPSDASAALDREAPRSLRALPVGRPSPLEATFRPATGWREASPRCSAARGIVPAMVALDSALNRGALPMQGSESIRGLVPACGSSPARPGVARAATPGSRRSRACCSCGGTSGCGRRSFLAGVGRVDLLVGDRLVLELDGRAFHSGEDFEATAVAGSRARHARVPRRATLATGW